MALSIQDPPLSTPAFPTSIARLTLRPFTPADAPFILRLLNEPSFLEHIGDRGVRDLEGAGAYLQGGPLASYAAHGHGLQGVVLRATGELIGTCGLLRRDHLPAPDLGYAFLPEHWGKGYAEEAARATLAHGVAAFGYHRILAIVSPANGPSIRLLEKLGFAFEGWEVMPEETEAVGLYAWAAE